MSTHLQAVRGMNDLLPAQATLWQRVESVLSDVIMAYGFQEIRLPLLESTALFARAIGEVTDIVEKEMYTFADRHGESLTLRPEGTAGCVRAVLEHGMLHHQVHKLFYQGAMFRYERPQKGRYRQFHQFGCEVFGLAGPDIDAELILASARCWRMLGVDAHLRLEINSLGDIAARQRYRQHLVEYLQRHRELLDEDSLRRLEHNPLRVLDSKHPPMQEMLAAAPRLLDHIDDAAREHFESLCALLRLAGIEPCLNPRLVRGLDYYNRSVFEWVTTALGAQGTVCAGGRYDGLVEQLGGAAPPAVGMAIGLERLVLLMETMQGGEEVAQADVIFLGQGERFTQLALPLAERLRDGLPGVRVLLAWGGGGFKSQFRKADRSGARCALILGEQEIEEGRVGIKWLREDREQIQVTQEELVDHLRVTLAW